MINLEWDPEPRTTIAPGTAIDQPACCTPVSFAWAVPEGAAVLVGLRHTGPLCAGQFQEMPYSRWSSRKPRKRKVSR